MKNPTRELPQYPQDLDFEIGVSPSVFQILHSFATCTVVNDIPGPIHFERLQAWKKM